MQFLGSLGKHQGRVENRLYPLVFVRWLVKRRHDDRVGVNLLNGPVCPICGIANVCHRSLDIRAAMSQDVPDLHGNLVGLIQ